MSMDRSRYVSRLLSSSDDLTQEIFLALVRASSPIRIGKEKKNIMYKNVRRTFPTVKRHVSKEMSFFKSNNVKELIFILGEKLNQEAMESMLFTEFIENKRQYKMRINDDRDAATRLHAFNDHIRITSSKGCIEEKSIIVRMIYALMGINPYRNFDTDRQVSLKEASLKIDFEAGKLINHMQQAIEKEKYLDPIDSSSRHPYGSPLIIMAGQRRLIEDAREVIRSKFMTMTDDELPNMPESRRISTFEPAPIKLDHILKVWGGSYKAYKNGIEKDDFPEPFEFEFYNAEESHVDYYKHIGKGARDKELALERRAAEDFLESRQINCIYISKQRSSDRYWNLEKLFQEMGENITIRNAKKVLSSNTQNISENSK